MRKSRIRLWLASGCVCAAAIAAIPTIADGASGSPPAVTSAAATNVTSGGATLDGNVNPNGQDSSYAFDWGQRVVAARTPLRRLKRVRRPNHQCGNCESVTQHDVSLPGDRQERGRYLDGR